MVHINLNDLSGIEHSVIAEKLQTAGPALRLTISVRDQYRAGSKTELAENWLKTWYIAEMLASCSSAWTCDFAEAGDGEADFEFRLTVSDFKKMAAVLAAFAAVLDPDDLEAGAFIYDEAHEWLEKRGDEPARFPDIEKCYRDDADVARDFGATWKP